MRLKIVFFITITLIFSACSNNYNLDGVAVDESSSIICAKLSDGVKQTFPSITEMQKVNGATYLYDGPCYDY